MPEYLTPGVYVEETSFRSKSIEGTSTSTAGFVGPTRSGPITGDPELLTSLADFERIYGGFDDLVFDGKPQINYLAYAVSSFFAEGGKRLYVSRVFNFGPNGYTASKDKGGVVIPATGYARYYTPDNPALQPEPSAATQPPPVTLQPMWLISRFPGSAGNMRVTFTLQAGTSVLTRKADGSDPTLTRVQSYDLIHIREQQGTPPTWKPVGTSSDGLYLIRWDATQNDWLLTDDKGAETALKAFSSANPDPTLQIRPVSVTVQLEMPIGQSRFDTPVLLGSFGFDPRSVNALTATFTRIPATRLQFLTTPFSLELSDDLKDPTKTKENQLAVAIIQNLLGSRAISRLLDDKAHVTERQIAYTLANGTDGSLPTGAFYAGDDDTSRAHDFIDDPLQRSKNGLLAFEGVEDISIAAAPGYSAPQGYNAPANLDNVFAIHNALIDHCEKMHYRIAVLDTPPLQLVSDTLAFRNNRSSKYAALYYPWVTIADPRSNGRLQLPPSGFIAGIYARNDINRSVSKAPANEVIGSAIDFEQRINKAQQEVLNPAGVNCLRFFSGHGFLVWGARTISDDPEWKYVNLRRYFAYLEHSLDRGTQWVVFENNSQQLWDNVRRTVEDFLFNEWRMGSLMGSKPEEAYFVRCDLSTMTQNDLDNGRLICLIGVAPVRPAEFVIFRVGQWTASASSR